MNMYIKWEFFDRLSLKLHISACVQYFCIILSLICQGMSEFLIKCSFNLPNCPEKLRQFVLYQKIDFQFPLYVRDYSQFYPKNAWPKLPQGRVTLALC